jgi:hypothetical protein
MKKVLFLASALSLLFVVSTQAGSTSAVYWNFSPPGAPQSSPTSNSFTGLTVSPFTQNNNNGTTAPFTTTSASSTYMTAAGFSNSGSTNLGAAVAPGTFDTSTSTYLGFNLSLSSSSTLSYTISDFSFGTRSTGTGPQTLSLYASRDDFVSDLTLLGSLTVPNTSSWSAQDFSGLSLALNNDDSTLSFRLYGSGVVGTPTAGTATWRIDDPAVILTPVPEPSSLALGIMGGLAGLAAWKRRK